MERIVEACRVERERRALRAPLDVLAISMGAMVAVAWANLYPGELRRCVLVNTSLRPYAPFYRRLRPSNILALLRAALTDDAVAREHCVLRLTSSNPAANTRVIDEWLAIARRHPVTRGNVMRQLLAAARYRAPPERPRCDLLMLASTCDRLVDVRCSRALAHAWHVPLVEHPTAGHDLPLDDPRWVIEQVRAWAGVPALREVTRA